MMRKLLALTLLSVAAVSAIGCSMHPMSAEEKAAYAEITEQPPRGLGLESQSICSPGLAAIPVFGRFYLLAATGDHYQWIPIVAETFSVATVVGAEIQVGKIDESDLGGYSRGTLRGVMPVFWYVLPIASWNPWAAMADARNANKRHTIWWYIDPAGPGNELYKRKKDELKPKPSPTVIPAAKVSVIPSEK